MSRELRHIELFAGCGGMSLGLDSAGFDLFFANELSPMAAETFAYNILGEDLKRHSELKTNPTKVCWVKSSYPISKLEKRLRENPFSYPMGRHSDIDEKTDFEGKLLVGNIDHLLKFLAHKKTICTKLRSKNIDLLSGGPPCQGFSLAGKREKDDHKNLLPLSFAKFAGLVRPKVVLLENVKGILSPFEEDGVKYHAWLEVAKAFSLKGFVPVCFLINSKYFGIPQNRPRFILLGFRKDIYDLLVKKMPTSEYSKFILLNSLLFYNKVHKHKKSLNQIKHTDLKVYDIESDSEFFDGKLLPKITTSSTEFVTASKAIGDIKSTKKEYQLDGLVNTYPALLSKLFRPKHDVGSLMLQNHDPRKHGFKVKARFRLYQILNDLNGLKNDAADVIAGKSVDDTKIQKVFSGLEKYTLLVERNGQLVFEKPETPSFLKNYLQTIESKKHSQRAIKDNEPAPAQLTIPDDLCHYSSNELRTLTVREMARFQSFPDWFTFRSKVTTGGDQRSFEAPQYTQVGNAVPPILALELGKMVSRLIKFTEK